MFRSEKNNTFEILYIYINNTKNNKQNKQLQVECNVTKNTELNS